LKRRDVERWLRLNDAYLLRHGASHDVWVRAGRRSSLPRHREIKPETLRAICKQLDIPEP